MIEVQNLYKSFDGFNALNGLCVKVEKGSIYGLMGVNGSGKTTLIKHLTGVLRQDDGSVKISRMIKSLSYKINVYVEEVRKNGGRNRTLLAC